MQINQGHGTLFPSECDETEVVFIIALYDVILCYHKILWLLSCLHNCMCL